MIIITKGCEPLFDAFIAASHNSQEIIRNCGDIVQNDGVPLSLKEVDQWATDATQRLLAQHREQLQLITTTANALRGM